MSLVVFLRGPGLRRFPRVSGDEPCFRASASAFFMFSPRERG